METKIVTTEKEKVSYSLGVNIANSLKNQGFDDISLDAFNQAIADSLGNRPLQIDAAQGGKILNEYFEKIQERKHSKNIEEGAKFLKENAAKEGVIT
ncbi:MAG TPA: FKBP-type peptidyl-prolyl cis-trans isomerase N-terminal domain-containing protein, partial [Cytophagaceae bacterium]|nr:FKBP-type peptidyl-prolyl cis-trans isomerase N-terminal domain-containing protein [Cytophagaceae bacterium]